MASSAATTPRRQSGVAVVTALLVTSLAVTLVTGLFWQQQVMVRTMEGQRLRLQARLLGMGLLAEVDLKLRDSTAAQNGLITLDGLWRQPLQHEVKDGEGLPAALTGRVADAQSRFNLRNLAGADGINTFQLAAFARLLASLGLDVRLGPVIAAAMAPGKPVLAPHDCGDLRTVSGITAPVLATLCEFVVVLPEPTPVNVNTASAEVLTAVASLTLPEARMLVLARDRAWFRSRAEFAMRLNERETLEGVDFNVTSNYFLVDSSVRMERVDLHQQALVRRHAERRLDLLWLRQR